MPSSVQEEIVNLNQQVAQLCRAGQYTLANEIAAKAHILVGEHLDQKHPAYLTSVSNLAALYYNTGNYRMAKPLFEKVLQLEHLALDEHELQVAAILNNLAVVCTATGEYAEAEKYYQQALAIRRTRLGEKGIIIARTLNDWAELCRQLGKYVEAEAKLATAIEIYSGMGESLDLARSLNSLAILHMNTGEYAKARPFLEQALKIRQDLGGKEHPEVAETLNNLGYLYYATRNYTEALSFYCRAIEIDRQVFGAQHPNYAADLNNLALLYYEIGHFAVAQSHWEEAIQIWRKMLGETHPQVARGLNNLAELYTALGNYRAAEPLAQQAVEIRRAALGQNHLDYSISLTTMAKLYELTGNLTQAERLYQQVVKIRSTSRQNPSDLAESLNNLAALYTASGKYGAAESLYLQAGDIWRKAEGESPNLAIALNNLATLYRERGRDTEAEHAYKQSRGILDAAMGQDVVLLAATLNNLAELYRDRGDYAAAEPLYDQASGIWQKAVGQDHPDYGRCRNNLAMLLGATGREAQALALMKQNAKIDDRLIGQVFSMGSESQRMSYMVYLKGHLDAYISLVIHSQAVQPAGVQSAFDLVLRRKAIGAEALAAQRDAVLSGKYPELETELAKLFTLRRAIAQKTLAGPSSDGIDAHEAVLAEWHTQREQLEAELAHRVPEIDVQQKLGTADCAAVAKALPPGTALVEFVRFHRMDYTAVPTRRELRWKSARYAAFVLCAGKPDLGQMVDLGEAKPIDQMIAAYRASITGEEEAGSGRGAEQLSTTPSDLSVCSEPAALRSAIKVTRALRPPGWVSRPEWRLELGTRLRQALFDPLLRSTGGRKRLFLSPDGDLARLPFETLPMDKGRYLIDEYHISYLSVGRDILRYGATSSAQAAKALVVADPDFNLANLDGPKVTPDTPFTRLKGTSQEGKKVAALLKVDPVMCNQALEREIKACQSPRVLHVASHGFFLPDAPRDPSTDIPELTIIGGSKDVRVARLARVANPLLRSALVLAGANTWLQEKSLPEEAEDGLLTAEDVAGLDLLKTELVVLSACETGLGQVQVGEGVFGLRRSFMLAGARTLVMSLWKVPDRQTQELMVNFYQRMLAGQPRAEVLRKAQLAIKAKYPDPLYWGAFICQGDPGPLAHRG